jgi:VCBS repeat-containing protein
LLNDESDLVLVAVNGLSSNIGVAIDGSNGGVFTVNRDGSWTFSPDGDFELLGVSETAETSITYSASNGMTEATAELTVTVTHENTAPIAVDDEATTDSETTANGNVLTNDSDPENNSLTVSRVAGSSENVGVAVQGSNGGLFTINSNGDWTFDPNGDFASLSGTDSADTAVTYHASDGTLEDEATLTITVVAASGIEILNTYTFATDFTDSEPTSPINLVNSGLTLSGGDIYGDGYTDYAKANLGIGADKYYTFSVWASRINDTDGLYQFIFGSECLSTTSTSNWTWFVCFYNGKICFRNYARSDVVEPLNTPVHILVVLNPITADSKLYRNGVLVWEGAMHKGTRTGSLNWFQVAGFSSFSGSYCRPSKVHSVEIIDGAVTAAQALALYQKGVL